MCVFVCVFVCVLKADTHAHALNTHPLMFFVRVFVCVLRAVLKCLKGGAQLVCIKGVCVCVSLCVS